MSRPLDAYEQWMVQSNLDHAKVEGVSSVVARLRFNGYPQIADAVEALAPKPPAEAGPDAGCPWCGESAEDMRAAAGVSSFDAALEAHVEDCPPYQAEQSPSTSM